MRYRRKTYVTGRTIRIFLSTLAPLVVACNGGANPASQLQSTQRSAPAQGARLDEGPAVSAPMPSPTDPSPPEGPNLPTPTPQTQPETGSGQIIDPPTSLAGAEVYSLAVRQSGTLWGWGSNDFNRLLLTGTTTAPRRIMFPNDPSDQFIMVAAGESFALALRGPDGIIWGWGLNNAVGERGDGELASNPAPTRVVKALPSTFLTGATQIAAGQDHAVALVNREVWGWGNNASGALAASTAPFSSIAIPMRDASGLIVSDVTQVAAGAGFTCALKADSTVWCWGRNTEGQLGRFDDTTDSKVPRPVKSNFGILGNVIGIAAGSSHMAALTSDGSVVTWGDNQRFQLGNGGSPALNLNIATRNVALPVVATDPQAPLPTFLRISAGWGYTMAANNTSTWIWGDTPEKWMPTPLMKVINGAQSPYVGTLMAAQPTARHRLSGDAGLTGGSAWGDNGVGQLGDASTVTRALPVPIKFP